MTVAVGCAVAALQGAALTAGGFIQPTYIADTGAAAAAAAAAGTGLRYPSSLLPAVVATSNGLQYAMYVFVRFPFVFQIVWLTVCRVDVCMKCPLRHWQNS